MAFRCSGVVPQHPPMIENSGWVDGGVITKTTSVSGLS